MAVIVVPGGMNISLEVIETDKQIQQKILLECTKQVNSKVVKVFPAIKSRAEVATVIHFIKSPVYRSLVGVGLAGHFGLKDGIRDMQVLDIIYQLSKEIQVRLDPFKVSGGKFSGGVIYEFMKDDFSTILSMPQAKVAIKDGSLPWLQWLLMEGDRIIVSDYCVDFRPGSGRSKQAIMVSKKGGSWRVPPWAAGTRTDNWLTRETKDSRSWYFRELKKIIEEEIKKVL